MPDPISKQERALIDEAVAAGRVTRCPTAHGFYEYTETVKQMIGRQMMIAAAQRRVSGRFTRGK